MNTIYWRTIFYRNGAAPGRANHQARLNQPKSAAEMLPQTHDFKSYQEIPMTMGGWFRADQKPPVMPPPPSTEWVKRQ